MHESEKEKIPGDVAPDVAGVQPDNEVTTGSQPGVAVLDDITSALADASPTPNSSAINAHAEKQSAVMEEFADARDVQGNRFDPELHVTDADGKPKLTKLKKLRMKAGRKSAKRAASISRAATSQNDRNVPGLSPSEKLQARATGEAAAGALITLGVVIGGDEWNPQINVEHGLNERENLSHAFGDYFEQKEMTDIPPGVALTIAISAYILPRFTMPKTQTRVQRFKEWVVTKIAKRKMRKNSGAQSDTRNDGKRKDDASETTSEKS